MSSRKVIEPHQHWIVVDDHWDEDLGIKHSPDCPRGQVIVDADESGYEYGEGYKCAVAAYINDVELEKEFRHVDSEVNHWDVRTALVPGEHEVWLLEEIVLLRDEDLNYEEQDYRWWLTTQKPEFSSTNPQLKEKAL